MLTPFVYQVSARDLHHCGARFYTEGPSRANCPLEHSFVVSCAMAAVSRHHLVTHQCATCCIRLAHAHLNTSLFCLCNKGTWAPNKSSCVANKSVANLPKIECSVRECSATATDRLRRKGRNPSLLWSIIPLAHRGGWFVPQLSLVLCLLLSQIVSGGFLRLLCRQRVRPTNPVIPEPIFTKLGTNIHRAACARTRAACFRTPPIIPRVISVDALPRR